MAPPVPREVWPIQCGATSSRCAFSRGVIYSGPMAEAIGLLDVLPCSERAFGIGVVVRRRRPIEPALRLAQTRRD